MNDMSSCKEFENEIVKCSRCGACRSICPISLAENAENTTARSKIRMIEAVLEGELELTPAVQDRFDKCLLCMACKANCGSGVATDEIILGTRTHLVKRNGLNSFKRMAYTSLRYRRLFDLGLRMGAVFQWLVFKNLPNGRGKVARIPLPAAGLNLRRVIPNLTSRPLRSRLPVMNKAKTAECKGRVAFFTGCALNYMYPQAGDAVVKILTGNGWDVIIPDEQCCCGKSAFTSGDVDTGRILAEQNIRSISAHAVDHVVIACGSCGEALQSEYERLLAGSPQLAAWRELSEKVVDIAQFVVQHCDMSKFGTLPLKITYHDSCHLVRGMKVSAEPRQIFRSIPGLEYVEMKDADRCCGAGGTFSAAYYELSRKINDVKIDNVEATAMEYVVSGCPACQMHINDGLSRRNSPVKMLYTAELIAMAYDAGKKE